MDSYYRDVTACHLLYNDYSFPSRVSFRARVEQEQLALWSGLSFSISFFIAAIMAPVWGRLADQHGKKLMAIRAGILIGLSYLWSAFVQDEYQFLLVRAFQGFANGFMPAAMTMVSLSVPKERVGTAMGIFQMGLVLGNTVGPLTGGLTELAVGMRPVFMVAGITFIYRHCSNSYLCKRTTSGK